MYKRKILFVLFFFFFFNDTATTEIYTLSLHDALPISLVSRTRARLGIGNGNVEPGRSLPRSEEHTSELQSRQYLVCRLLLEKKKNINNKLTLTNKNYKDNIIKDIHFINMLQQRHVNYI